MSSNVGPFLYPYSNCTPKKIYVLTLCPYATPLHCTVSTPYYYPGLDPSTVIGELGDERRVAPTSLNLRLQIQKKRRWEGTVRIFIAGSLSAHTPVPYIYVPVI